MATNDYDPVVEQFRAAAIAHYDATLAGEWKKTQVTSGRLEDAKSAISLSDNARLEQLEQLLRDPSAGVRLASALMLAPLGMTRAIWLLRMMAWFRRDEIGLLAKVALEQRKGRFAR